MEMQTEGSTAEVATQTFQQGHQKENRALNATSAKELTPKKTVLDAQIINIAFSSPKQLQQHQQLPPSTPMQENPNPRNQSQNNGN